MSERSLSGGAPEQAPPGSELRTAASTGIVEPSARSPIVSAERVARRVSMRSIVLWLIGIPIPIILLIALCTHHF